ncbi:unnamed protein product [Moneuplotes crassus]|uniref:Uncharacterized protein n=1 Tax=Euplotes crassus TaxID=5936 RepID=A0AAD2D329_EUPCR|nr:unnamed protein product [Moneuplotes crassus]
MQVIVRDLLRFGVRKSEEMSPKRVGSGVLRINIICMCRLRRDDSTGISPFCYKLLEAGHQKLHLVHKTLLSQNPSVLG